MAYDNNEQYNSTAITATTQIKTAPAQLGGFICANTGGGTVTIYDSPNGGTTTKLLDTITPNAGQAYPCPCKVNTGLYVVISGTVSISVLWN